MGGGGVALNSLRPGYGSHRSADFVMDNFRQACLSVHIPKGGWFRSIAISPLKTLRK